MDEATFKSWWSLHLRVARREQLSLDERAHYEAGLRQLHQAEILDGDLGALLQAKASLAAAEAQRAQLQERERVLAEEIATLEAALDESTRRQLARRT